MALRVPFPSLLAAGAALAALAAAPARGAEAELPAAVALPGRPVLMRLHAEGVQIYECKANAQGAAQGADGAAAWSFREPLATLMRDGRTVGRHYAGPGWALDDGSAITARLAAKAPGATPADIPLLRLDVTGHSGAGALAGAAAVQRLATRGGTLAGPCPTPGELRLVPYAAEYVFTGP